MKEILHWSHFNPTPSHPSSGQFSYFFPIAISLALKSTMIKPGGQVFLKSWGPFWGLSHHPNVWDSPWKIHHPAMVPPWKATAPHHYGRLKGSPQAARPWSCWWPPRRSQLRSASRPHSLRDPVGSPGGLCRNQQICGEVVQSMWDFNGISCEWMGFEWDL